GDLDGDGLADVVVTDPESAQMIVYRQQRGRGLDAGSTFPGLVGASQVRVSDLDGNKAAEVVVLSTKEKTLAVSRLENERLTFPDSLPIEHEPAVFDLADLNGDGRPEIIYLAKDSGNRKSAFFLHALTRDATTGNWRPLPFGEAPQIDLNISATPTRLMTLDAKRDDRPDFLVFTGIDTVPQLFTSNEKGIPVAAVGQRGIGLGEISPGAVFLGQLTSASSTRLSSSKSVELGEPAILVAWKNFARNVRLEPSGQWHVVDQYNASESNAKIVGAATIDLDGEPGNEVVLIDAGVGKLRVLRREMNLYRPWREVEIGAFPFKSALTEDLNGDGHADLLLFGRGKFGVVYAGQTDPVLDEVASFETRLEKTFFSDVAAGDLNGDGRVDLALTDARSHFIELLDLGDEQKLRHALHFKLFEEKTIAREQSAGTEPREAVIADVTNDGRSDLILLSHDRVLLYPQDDGK
ncbi:MAG: VCBS repeat-containing protein, partial [Planctomycetaceae bacterium]